MKKIAVLTIVGLVAQMLFAQVYPSYDLLGRKNLAVPMAPGKYFAKVPVASVATLEKKSAPADATRTVELKEVGAGFEGVKIGVAGQGGEAGVWGNGPNMGIFGSSPSWAGYFNGHGWLTTSSFFYNSDLRAKANIRYFADQGLNAIAVINQLKPANFDTPPSFAQLGAETNAAGFIAQDVQTVLPNLVGNDPGGWKGVQTTNLIPYLVKGMQEQQAEITALKAEIEGLKKSR
jgi:hypothetical protein